MTDLLDRLRAFGVPEAASLSDPDVRVRIACVGWYAPRELELMPSGRHRHGRRLTEYVSATFLAIAVDPNDGSAIGYLRVDERETETYLVSETGGIYLDHMDLAYVRGLDLDFDDAFAATNRAYDDFLQWLEDNRKEQ